MASSGSAPQNAKQKSVKLSLEQLHQALQPKLASLNSIISTSADGALSVHLFDPTKDPQYQETITYQNGAYTRTAATGDAKPLPTAASRYDFFKILKDNEQFCSIPGLCEKQSKTQEDIELIFGYSQEQRNPHADADANAKKAWDEQHKKNKEAIKAYLAAPSSSLPLEVTKKLVLNKITEDTADIKAIISLNVDGNTQVHLFRDNNAYLTTITCQTTESGDIEYVTEKLSNHPKTPAGNAFALGDLNKLLEDTTRISQLSTQCAQTPGDLNAFNAVADYKAAIETFQASQVDNFENRFASASGTQHSTNLQAREEYLIKYSAIKLLETELEKLFPEAYRKNELIAREALGSSSDQITLNLYSSTAPRTYCGKITYTPVSGNTDCLRLNVIKESTGRSSADSTEAGKADLKQAQILRLLKKEENQFHLKSNREKTPQSLQDYNAIADYAPDASKTKETQARLDYLKKHSALALLISELEKQFGADNLKEMNISIDDNTAENFMIINLFNQAGNYQQSITLTVIEVENRIDYRRHKKNSANPPAPNPANKTNLAEMLAEIDQLYRFREKLNNPNPSTAEISEVAAYKPAEMQIDQKYTDLFQENQKQKLQSQQKRAEAERKNFLQRHFALGPIKEQIAQIFYAHHIALKDARVSIEYNHDENTLLVHAFIQSDGRYIGTISATNLPNSTNITSINYNVEQQEVIPASDNLLPENTDFFEILERNEAILKFQKKFEQEPKTFAEIKEILECDKHYKDFLKKHYKHLPNATIKLLAESNEKNLIRRSELLEPQAIIQFLFITETKPAEKYQLIEALQKKSLDGVSLPANYRIIQKPSDDNSGKPSFLLLEYATESDASATKLIEFSETQTFDRSEDNPDINVIKAESPLVWKTKSHTCCLVLANTIDPDNTDNTGYELYTLAHDSVIWHKRTPKQGDIKFDSTACIRDVHVRLNELTKSSSERPLSDLLLQQHLTFKEKGKDSTGADITRHTSLMDQDAKLNLADKQFRLIELPKSGAKQRKRYVLQAKHTTDDSYISMALFEQTKEPTRAGGSPICRMLATNPNELEELGLEPITAAQEDSASRLSRYLSFSTTEHGNHLIHHATVDDDHDRKYNLLSTITDSSLNRQKELALQAQQWYALCTGSKKPLAELTANKIKTLNESISQHIASLELDLKSEINAISYKQKAALCNQMYSAQQQLETVLAGPDKYFFNVEQLLTQNISTGRVITTEESASNKIFYEGKGLVKFSIEFKVDTDGKKSVEEIVIPKGQMVGSFAMTAACAEICDINRRADSGLTFDYLYTSDKTFAIQEMVEFLEDDNTQKRPNFTINHYEMAIILNAITNVRKPGKAFSSEQITQAEKIKQTLGSDKAKWLFELAWGNNVMSESLKQYGIDHPEALSETAAERTGRGIGLSKPKPVAALEIIKQYKNLLVSNTINQAKNDEHVQTSFDFSGKSEGMTPIKADVSHTKKRQRDNRIFKKPSQTKTSTARPNFQPLEIERDLSTTKPASNSIFGKMSVYVSGITTYFFSGQKVAETIHADGKSSTRYSLIEQNEHRVVSEQKESQFNRLRNYFARNHEQHNQTKSDNARTGLNQADRYSEVDPESFHGDWFSNRTANRIPVTGKRYVFNNPEASVDENKGWSAWFQLTSQWFSDRVTWATQSISRFTITQDDNADRDTPIMPGSNPQQHEDNQRLQTDTSRTDRSENLQNTTHNSRASIAHAPGSSGEIHATNTTGLLNSISSTEENTTKHTTTASRRKPPVYGNNGGARHFRRLTQVYANQKKNESKNSDSIDKPTNQLRINK